jgi:CubicO group peptidase (beta-lactamase class C family)
VQRWIVLAGPLGDGVHRQQVAARLLLNAVVRRVTGRALKDIWNEDVAAPLGLDFSLGAPDADLDRIAKVYNPCDIGPLPRGSLLARAFHETESQPTLLEALAEFGSNLRHSSCATATAISPISSTIDRLVQYDRSC